MLNQVFKMPTSEKFKWYIRMVDTSRCRKLDRCSIKTWKRRSNWIKETRNLERIQYMYVQVYN